MALNFGFADKPIPVPHGDRDWHAAEVCFRRGVRNLVRKGGADLPVNELVGFQLLQLPGQHSQLPLGRIPENQGFVPSADQLQNLFHTFLHGIQ